MVDDNAENVKELDKGRDTSPPWSLQKYNDGTSEVWNRYEYTIIAAQFYKGDALEQAVTVVNAHAALEARVAALEATAETVLAILDSRDADAVWESNLRKLLRDTLKGGRP